MMPRWARVRMVVVAALLALGLGASAIRAWDLQIRRHDDLRAMAEEQYLKEVEVAPSRGSIVDRNGEPLAVSVDVDSVYANPREIGDFAGTADKLARVLGLEARKLREKLARGRSFVWVKRRIDGQDARRVRQAGLRGVSLVEEARRFYPGRELAASTIGFTDVDSQGIDGLELSLDATLRGRRRLAAGLRDALGRELLVGGSVDAASASGDDVTLTLDRRIQHVADQALAAAVTEHGARSGAAVFTDPRSGEILALSTFPSYNPNEPKQAGVKDRRNYAVADVFEPGSTMKTFSIAAALDRGVVSPTDRFHCEWGAYTIGEYVIHDHDKNGWLDVGGILQRSSNIGAAKIARRLGREALHDALARFGFGRETGIELRGERAGALRPASRWSEVGLANIAFGQGVTVTAVQLAAALGAIADDGRVHPPRLVREVRDGKGRTLPAEQPTAVQAISPATARQMTSLLTLVTESDGTGALAAIPGYTVAGKTGTAQKVDPVTGTYSSDAFVASFVGFVPAEAPRLLGVVVIDEPQGKIHFGGQVAAPVFRAVATETLRLMGIAPRPTAVATGPGPSVGKAAVAADDDRAADGFVALREPAPAGGGSEVPDFTGLSLAEALEVAHRLGLRPVLVGSGRAVGQSPGPGTADPGTTVRIVFAPPG
jgi:cell division protein FtsI (penicillin-binding protein 3)